MDLQSEIKRFEKDWEIDLPKCEIRRRSPSGLKKVVELLVRPKYPVAALYRVAQARLSSEEGIVYPNFIDRTAGNEVAGVPSWYSLSPKWSISKRDQALLFSGPLVKGSNVLVPAVPEKGFVITTYELVKVLAAFGGVIAFLTWFVSSLR